MAAAAVSPSKEEKETSTKNTTTGKEEEHVSSHGLRGLFTFASGLDYTASVIASLCLGGLGVAMVAFIWALGPFLNAVSDAESAGGGVDMNIIVTMFTLFVVLGVAQFGVSLPGFAVANMSAARQKRAWQKAVVKSILRQNVGWYAPTPTHTKFCSPRTRIPTCRLLQTVR
jgi:ABC-type multidrug transport system fused ATPase/permease subunit